MCPVLIITQPHMFLRRCVLHKSDHYLAFEEVQLITIIIIDYLPCLKRSVNKDDSVLPEAVIFDTNEKSHIVG